MHTILKLDHYESGLWGPTSLMETWIGENNFGIFSRNLNTQMTVVYYQKLICILLIDYVIIGPSGYKCGSFPHNDHT